MPQGRRELTRPSSATFPDRPLHAFKRRQISHSQAHLRDHVSTEGVAHSFFQIPAPAPAPAPALAPTLDGQWMRAVTSLAAGSEGPAVFGCTRLGMNPASAPSLHQANATLHALASASGADSADSAGPTPDPGDDPCASGSPNADADAVTSMNCEQGVPLTRSLTQELWESFEPIIESIEIDSFVGMNAAQPQDE